MSGPGTLQAQAALAAREAQQRTQLRLGANTVDTPPGYQPPAPLRQELSLGGAALRLYARRLAQGEAALLEFSADFEPGDRGLQVDGQRTPLTRTSRGWQAVIALPVDAAAIRLQLGPQATISLPIAAVAWPEFRTQMDLGSFSQPQRSLSAEARQRIAEEGQRKARAVAQRNEWLLDEHLSHPRDMHRITSPFWSRRIVQQYRLQGGRRLPLEPRSTVHRGLDLRAVEGAAVFAMARGRAALAGQFFYEGGFVLLDHGQGVFTMYLHMSKVMLGQGGIVEAGQQIGLAGATGMVTAAHLHVALSIRGQAADPLSLLSLPTAPAQAP
ncbi:MAG: M23 family metallopeptidase [Leptospirales bacterium]|nr:M23 family metallopeptidase [Leptospirales bacterium]